jgi:hypothetical protein
MSIRAREQLVVQWADFHENFYASISRKPVEKIQDLLQV